MLAVLQQPIAHSTSLRFEDEKWIGEFEAMSCPCEILMSGCDQRLANKGLELVSNEAWRIENKFSRYNDNSIVGQINRTSGQPVSVDDETARLIECAATLFTLSEGLFDITAGVLGKIWKFDQKNQPPSQGEIDKLLPLIGWQKVNWHQSTLTLAPGMQIDFGGIGKEYAVDCCLALVRDLGIEHVLINLGGDVAANQPQADGQPWNVGIEQIDGNTDAGIVVQLKRGGIATSGDQRRYIEYNGKRYCHILNPQSGWPVASAPKSVTVLAASSSEAGMYSTLALLSGAQAEQFLTEQQIQHWIQR